MPDDQIYLVKETGKYWKQTPAGWLEVPAPQKDAPSGLFIPSDAKISARPRQDPIQQWLETAESDVKYGTTGTLLGRLLSKLGAKGTDVAGGTKAMPNPILGALEAAHAFGETDPRKQLNQAFRAIGTTTGPAGILAGATAPEAASGGLAQQAASKLAKKIGLGDENSEFIGNLSGIAGSELLPRAGASLAHGFRRAQTQTGETFAELVRQKYTKSLEEYKSDLNSAQTEHAQKVAEAGKDNAQLQAEYQLASKAARDAHTQRIAEARQEYLNRVEKFKKESAEYAQSQANAQEKFDFARQQGPAFERAAGMARKLGENDLPKTFEKVKTANDAEWNAFRVALGEKKEVPQAPIYEAITNAEDNILAGSHEKIALFRDILKDAEDGNPLSGASVFRGAGRDARGGGIKIDDATLAPAAKQRFLASLSEEDRALVMGQGAEPVGSVPFDEARRTYTALNRAEQRALNSGHGDVFRALESVKKVVDAQINSVIPEELQPRYKALKQNHSQYARDWYSNKSPIKRLMNAPNDQARITMVSGPNAEELVRAMDRYKAYGADPEIANKIRSIKQQVDAMKVTRAKSPEEITSADLGRPVKVPSAPESKQVPPFMPPPPPEMVNMYKARLDKLMHQFETNLNASDTPTSRFGILRGAYRRYMAKMLSDEMRREWIAQESPRRRYLRPQSITTSTVNQ
jgi:hypothetical protein